MPVGPPKCSAIHPSINWGIPSATHPHRALPILGHSAMYTHSGKAKEEPSPSVLQPTPAHNTRCGDTAALLCRSLSAQRSTPTQQHSHHTCTSPLPFSVS
eukprot:GGOE01009098.1.p3 GENE.GGOE01009098.1~~GGOE01009098.1.p3  ORF type:complete len:100 (-),score=8.40 GGOE01009098.1:257-556(-)